MGSDRIRLIEQDLASLTMAKAVEVAQQAACARQARAGGSGIPGIKEEPLHKMTEKRGAADGAGLHGTACVGVGTQHGSASGSRCAVVIGNHDSVKFRFKNDRCPNCGNKGHLKKMCKEKNHGKTTLVLKRKIPTIVRVRSAIYLI